ncbi:unnamed protein product, partial [Meganyctiphanes norvegica]
AVRPPPEVTLFLLRQVVVVVRRLARHITAEMGKGSRSSKKGAAPGSSAFACFDEMQVQEYMDGFKVMDRDKDGILGMDDLRHIFEEIGRIVQDAELEEMLGEADPPMNPTNFITMFANKMEGEVDPDAAIEKAFKAFECKEVGTIESDGFRTALMAFGDKFTAKEVDEAFDEMEIDDNGLIDIDCLLELFISAKDDD